MLQEVSDATSWSATRFSFVTTVVMSNISVWSMFIYVTLKDGIMPDIAQGTLFLYALANGISFAGKVWQKGKEPINDTTNQLPPAEAPKEP